MATIAEIRSKFPQYSDMSDAELADALYKKFYSDLPRNEFNAKVGLQTKPAAPSTERTFGEAIKDVPASLATGLGGLLQVPGQLVQLVPGLQEVGKAIEAPGKAVREFGEDLKSAGLKAREALRSQALSEAEKEGVISEFVTAIKSTITDPALLTSFITEQVPLLLGPAVAAKVAQMATAGGVAATTAGTAARKAAEAAAAKTATRAAVGTGAAMQAGDVSSDTYQTAYQRAIEMGMTPDQANDAALNAARIAAAGAGVTSLGATAALGKVGGAAIERRLAGLPGAGRIKSGFGEAVSETGEEVGGQFFSNVGVRTVDPNQSLTTGLGTAGAMGALGGGLFGTLLGKGSGPDLAPGQKPGESLYDTAMRLNREIKDVEDLAKLAESDKARANAGLMTNTQLVDMYREQGYGAVKQYQQQLLNQAADPNATPDQRATARQAAKEIEDLFKQVTQEEVSRQMPLETQYTITASDLTKLEIKGSDPLYKAALGKDIRDPVQVQEIQDAIDAELNRKGLRQTQEARILRFKHALDFVIAETLPAGGLSAATTVESTGGEGAGVAGVSGVGATTAGSGAAKPSRVVSAEPAIEEPAGGKAEPTTPVMEDDITPQGTTGVVSEEKPAPAKQFTYEPAGSGDSHLGFTFGQVRFNLSNTSGKPQLVVTDPNRDGPIVFYAEGKKYDPRPNIYGSEQITEMVPSLPQEVVSSLQNWLSSKKVDPAQGQKVADALNGYKAPAPVVDATKPTVTQAVSKTPKEMAGGKLPKDLAGAKPRFSYGPKQFQLTFENDIAKALFITAQPKPSKRDADYRAWLTTQGFDPEQIELGGKRIRERIKTLAKNADPEAGPISVPVVTKPIKGKFSLAPEVKDKLEPIYKRLEQRVKTAKPEAKQEAKPEEAKAEAPKEKTQKDLLLERRAELVKQLDGILKKILAKYNLTGVKLNLEEGMAEEGSYSGQIIKLALNLDNPVRVLRHESIHALKDMGFFSAAQWKTLVKRAQDEWVEKYLKNKAHTETQSRYDAYVELLTKEGLNPTEVQEAIIEEAIADAFGDFDVNGAPPGLLAAIHRRMKSLFKAIKEAFGQAGIDTAEEIFGKIEKGSLKPAIPVGKQKSGKFNAWKATEADVEKAEAYEEKNGIKPYLSEGRLDLPTKYSIKTNVDKYGQDPILGIPLNKDGTVTVYYHTVKPNVFQINSSKIIPAEGRDRIYLTNESSGAKVYGKRGNFDQELDGSVVLLNINPSLLQIDQEYDDGRKDFFVPLTQGDFFNKKMQAAAIQAPRTKAIVEEFSYKDHQDRITGAVEKYNALTGKEKQALLKKARAVLKKEHNIGTLMTENGKLEKTRMGDYGLLWEGKPIDSMGLGLAAAQQISEKLSTCPNSAICQGLCLGETSGGNFLYGGAAREDVEDIEKTAFRAGPRMVQYLKTEALIIHPEEFAIVLQSEIDTLKKWDNSPTYRKKNKETGKLETLDKEIYQSAVRLNVTSDFRPEMWSSLFEANPDVMFYDYTKMLGNTPIAPNHHLTFSSTGFGQKIDGEDVFFKTKSGRYDHNWPQVRNRLNAGYNVAMAFSSKSALPKTLVDEETGVTYNILDGDDYDARFLDEKSPLKQGGIGVIVGLRNKASTLKEKTASKETDGFFVDYDPKRDGDSVTVPDQTQFGAPAYKAPAKTIPIEKKSLRAREVPKDSAKAFFKAAEKLPRTEGIEAVEEAWSGGVADFGDRDAAQYLGQMPGYSEYASELETLAWEHLAGGLYNKDKTVNQEAVDRDGRFYVYRYGDLNLVDDINEGSYEGKFEAKSTTLSINFARAFANFAAFDEESGANRGWMRIAVKPEAVIMVGSKSSEMELVVDLGNVESGTAEVIDETFQPESPEARFSLRSQTPEFKFWFGQSKIVDKDGKPKVMYHGTARDITEFRAKQAGAIFLTDDPEVSTGYSQESATWMADHADEFLTPKQIADSIKAAKKEMRENGYRPDQIAALEKDKGILKTDEFRNAVSVYMPSAPNIVPLFVKAEYTFDFENPKHVQAVISQLPEIKAEDFKRTNNWTTVEKPEVQEVLRAIGFDSFYVNEHGKKNLAVYSPTQVVSATGNVGAYRQRPITAEEAARFDMTEEQAADAQQRGDIRFSLRSPIGLYSELENKVEAVSSKAAPAGQWKTMIAAMTQKGVKPEEIEWSGVNDWLDLQTGKVSKDDLLEYLKANGVQVEEVQLGGRESWRQELDILENRGRINLNAQERERYDELMDRRREEGLPADEAPAKYQDYTLPGGENYREVLLTLPFQGGARVQKLLDEERYLVQPPERQRKIDAIKEAANVQYISRHWTQPNVLAHIRVNDRTDADGNKVLFVEEIQSDWGQEGKKKGFSDKKAEERARVAYEKARTINDAALLDGDYEKFQATKAAREKAHDAYIEASRAVIRGRIEVGPFVTKTEGWLNLALKRIMIMAAEGGYDKVAFVNGEQSADRYDLSKQVDSIAATRAKDGTYTLLIERGDGGDPINRRGVNEDELENTLGKEIAQKIVNDTSGEKQSTYLQGLDLKVGGEGMKTFYDKIVPTTLKKLLPKVGGGEMAVVDMPRLGEPGVMKRKGAPWPEEMLRQQPGFDVTPAMKEKVATTGLPKFSLRSTLPASVVKSMDKIAPPRYEPNLAERMMDAVSGDGFTRIRQHFLNRYEALAALDRRVAAFLKKNGGAKQYADSKAETAALFSDLSAGVLESVMGVHDGVGGAPIFRNGVTTVSNYGGAVKGLLEIFRPLSDMRSPEAFNLFQTWAAVKRGKRLTVEGREDLVDQSDVKAMQDLQRSNPQMIKTFEAVQKDWLAYNNALIKYMKDTGVISPEMSKKWTEHGDYWPFYRLTAEEDIVGPKAFMSIGNVTPPKKLKKSENPLGDFFENVVRNSQSAIQAGMKNMAAQNATKQGLMLGEVVRLKGREPGVHVYRVFENGKEVFYRAADPLFIEAIKALNMADIPFLGFLAKPAAWLRNLVTKDPAFMLANMMRDSLSAWVTTGKNITPIYSTLRNFSQAVAGQSPYINELYAAGLLGGYDYATGTKDAARVFEKTLRQKAGQKTALERAATPVTSLWEALEKGTQASDAATRIEIYKKVLAETGNEAEALSQALEVMNFNRKGNSALIRVLTAAVPFLNARLQGLDVLYRSAIQPLVLGNASEEAKQRMKTFWMRGTLMIGTSMMYWLLTHDDDEYKRQEQETRDDNWLIPSLGIRIPIPFEVGVLFKVIPERIMELNFGGDTASDFTTSMKRQFLNTFAFNPMPQTVKPLYEVATNHSFFTQRPIISMGMERVEGKYQIGPSTSRVAQLIGEVSGYSPMKTDYIIKGYTGTIGTYISDLIDMIWDMNSEAPKASKRFEQMPVIKRFITDPEARGTITSYYKFKEEVDTAVRTANYLERSNNFEDLAKYTVDNLALLASRDYVNDIEKDMKDLRELRNQVVNGPYSADTKRDLLRGISAMESAFTTNIQRIKQFGQA